MPFVFEALEKGLRKYPLDHPRRIFPLFLFCVPSTRRNLMKSFFSAPGSLRCSMARVATRHKWHFSASATAQRALDHLSKPWVPIRIRTEMENVETLRHHFVDISYFALKIRQIHYLSS